MTVNNTYSQAQSAISSKDLDALRELVQACPGLVHETCDQDGGNLLHDAAYANDVGLCRFLVESGCSTARIKEKRCCPDQPHAGSGSQSPLALALENNKHDAAVYLASVEVTPDNLWMAAALGNLERVQSFFDDAGQLLPAARDPNKAGDDSFVLADALVGAAHQGHMSVVVFLLERGANPSGRDQFGMTALHYAALGNLELATLLLDRDADVRVRDFQFNATPYGWAKFHGQEEIVSLIESRVTIELDELL